MKIPANNQVFFIKNVVAVAAYRSCRLWRWVKMSWIHDVLSGDSSCAVDSTDEDLESEERDLESLDSLWFLDRLTGVLGGLTGVLACLSASLARLTRELMELWGVWRNLSGDLGLLSGDPAGVADLLLVESCSGTGNDDWTARLMELSGTLGRSKRHWSNVHNDIKSTSVDWLMVFGMEGKSGGVLVPVRLETSRPPSGVAAGFPCPADPSTPAAGRGAGPSESSGSSKRNTELWDDSTIETSAGLSMVVSSTVVGPSTVTGPSPVAEPSPVAGPSPVAEPSPVVGSLPVAVPLRAAGPSLVADPPLAAGPAPAEPSATVAGTGTSGVDSIWICRAGEATTMIVRFSGALDFAGDSWTSRLATNVPPVLSELSRRLSRWLGWDLRSGDAREEDDERDRRSPEEWWWWRKEEPDGWVSDALETLPDSARLRELAPPEELGRARSLSLRSLLWPSRRDDWCLGDFWRFSSPCLLLRSGVLDLGWSDPWELGRPTAVTLEATDLGWEELVAVFDRLALDKSSDLVRLVGKASLGACNSTESSMISLSFFAAFAAAAALRRFLCAVALAWAVQASGSQSLHTRQGLSWVQSGKPSVVVIIPASEMGTLRKLWLRFGWWRPVTWSFCHFSRRHGLPKT